MISLNVIATTRHVIFAAICRYSHWSCRPFSLYYIITFTFLFFFLLSCKLIKSSLASSIYFTKTEDLFCYICIPYTEHYILYSIQCTIYTVYTVYSMVLYDHVSLIPSKQSVHYTVYNIDYVQCRHISLLFSMND